MRFKIALLLLIPFVFNNCSIKKEPEFIGVDEIKIINKTSRSIQLEILLEFNNPNLLGGTFSSDDLSLYLNSLKLNQLQSPLFEVPARSNFTMPIIATLDANYFKGKELEIISAIVSIGLSKKIDLKIEGPLSYKVAGYSSKYNVNYHETIELKKN